MGPYNGPHARRIAPGELLIFRHFGAITRVPEAGFSPIIPRAAPPRFGGGFGGAPMTNFDDREKSFERKFALDEELKFKSTARRNKLLGLWAAEKMGLSGDDAQAYAREVIKADFEEPGEEDVYRKIRADFDAKGVEQSEHQIRRAMVDLLAEAVRQIEAEARG
jgi:hypothetical protein